MYFVHFSWLQDDADFLLIIFCNVEKNYLHTHASFSYLVASVRCYFFLRQNSFLVRTPREISLTKAILACARLRAAVKGPCLRPSIEKSFNSATIAALANKFTPNRFLA